MRWFKVEPHNDREEGKGHLVIGMAQEYVAFEPDLVLK